MPQTKSVTPIWGDEQVPFGTPLTTGGIITLRTADGSVHDTQTVPLNGGAVSFSVAAGTGYYFQGQTMAGTAPVGSPVQSSPPFDVVEAPITIRVITGITVS